jgi:hypothetical protein
MKVDEELKKYLSEREEGPMYVDVRRETVTKRGLQGEVWRLERGENVKKC